MKKKLNIIVLYGGKSPEAAVSALSAKEIAKHLTAAGHSVVLLNLIGVYGEFSNFDELLQAAHQTDNFASSAVNEQVEITDSVLTLCQLADIAFLAALHGGIGENGMLQAVLELRGIPFSGDHFLSSAVGMDKRLTKKLVATDELKIAREFALSELTEADFPLVVKPNDNGSSIGVFFVDNFAELAALNTADVLIEEKLAGREFSVGVVGNEALPPIEIRVAEGFYDYDKKYTPGAAEEICPAEISDELESRLKRLALECHQKIGFEIYSRTDFIVDENETIYFIEANSSPGMTPTSLLPQEAAAIGMNYAALCERIIELSLKG